MRRLPPKALGAAETLASLAHLNSAELRALWREYFSRSVPVPPRAEFLLRCLAYRIQEKVAGGLSATLQKRLRKLADLLEGDPGASVADAPSLKPGTRLVREWRGETFEVTATRDGFSYRGKRYASLSEIARLITGTRWSGPLFFGLKVASKGAETRRGV